MPHLEGLAVTDAESAIAHLRQSVYAWMDADRVLPEEGSALLAALDRALAGMTGEEAARAGIERFVEEVGRLIEARLLPGREATAALAAARQIMSDR